MEFGGDAMIGAYALALVQNDGLNDDFPAPRPALGGGFAGDPPRPRGPAQILHFPVVPRRNGANGVAHSPSSALREEGSPVHGSEIPASGGAFSWRAWMENILAVKPAPALADAGD